MITTEIEFIKWIEDVKGIVINNTAQFSTMSYLGEDYFDKEGNYCFYFGLSIAGLPPHLCLSSIGKQLPYTKKEDLRAYYNKYAIYGKGDYDLIRKLFYNKDLTNEQRYSILTKKESLIITKEEAPI